MNHKIIMPFIAVLSLTSCSKNEMVTDRFFCFDTYVEIRLYNNDENAVKELKNIFTLYDKLSDNYQRRDLTNIYSINQTNSEELVDENLYKLLETSIDVRNKGATYFNPLCGSLAKKWKNALNNQQILDELTVNQELEKMNNSSINLSGSNYIQRDGEAEIDLGGIVKGYVLDEAKEYLDGLNYKQYIINAGNSSILLGEKNTKDGLFNIKINDIENGYLKLKDCVVSTSSKSVQGVTINGVTYSHIINPINGSAINENDAVIVISDCGYYGDAMSTSMMMNTIDEIKDLEIKHNIKTIIIKNGNIAYKNDEIEVYH